ncbi:MAG: hypothetical protein PHX61_07775 [Alphaproteobacteria bacterium]|nr:hypothetical protein [Alphaproteobacteria bacterium]
MHNQVFLFCTMELEDKEYYEKLSGRLLFYKEYCRTRSSFARFYCLFYSIMREEGGRERFKNSYIRLKQDLMYFKETDGLDKSDMSHLRGKENINNQTVDFQSIRKQQLKNDELEWDIKLRKKTLINLLDILKAETIVIFIFTFLQATHLCGFYLEEWSFRLVISATIAQVASMLIIAVKHLFPKK